MIESEPNTQSERPAILPVKTVKSGIPQEPRFCYTAIVNTQKNLIN